MISKFKNYFQLLIFGSLFTVSCTSDKDLLGVYNDELVFDCAKSLYWVEGRAVINNNGSGNFTEGDCMDMLISSGGEYSSLQPEYFEGKWIPSLKRSDYSSDEITLSAVFPKLPDSDGGLVRKVYVPTDQSNNENYTSADILFANTTLDKFDDVATLLFSHAMHRICINLKGNVPSDLQIGVRTRTKGKISLDSGTVEPDGTSSYDWVTPMKLDDETYTVIVLPQDAKDYQDNEGLIKLTSGGKAVVYQLDSRIETFSQGKQTTINLTLKNDGSSEVDTEFSNRACWVYGINAPEYPGRENLPVYTHHILDVPDGIWFRYTGTNDDKQFLTWKEDCGWFDCNKTYNYVNDGKMCWAAGASNLIHWWLVHNKKYIEAYDKRYGKEYDNIVRPEKYSKMTAENQEHSEVFNFFKRSFGNVGSWDTGAVNWFVNGDRSYIYPNIKGFDGFFRKIFGKGDVVSKEIKNPTKEKFNEWMKDAFRNQKAIGFASHDYAGNRTGLHAMTIWGAEFDEQGNVAYVYFCDNNSADTEPNSAAIKRFKIVYDKSSIPEIGGLLVYLRALDRIDGTIPPKFPISSLTLVDLRRDIWQKNFPEVK